MRSYFKEKGVAKHASRSSDVKAAVSERMIRTLKQRLYRWFSEKNALRWTEVVQKIADGINASVCRVTGVAPAAVDHANAEQIWRRVYGKERDPRYWDRPPKRFAVNTAVRIDKAKGAFHKSYLPG
jgi:hypothetical protein